MPELNEGSWLSPLFLAAFKNPEGRSLYGLENHRLTRPAPSSVTRRIHDEHKLRIVGRPHRGIMYPALWKRVCGMPPDELREKEEQYRLALDEAYTKREETLTAAREGTADTYERVKAGVVALREYDRIDLYLSAVEMALFFLDNYGELPLDYWDAKSLFENQPDYDGPDFDPSLAGFDEYEWRHIPMPSNEEMRVQVLVAVRSAWNYAVKLLRSGQHLALQAYIERLNAEIEKQGDRISNAVALIEQAQRRLQGHKGNDFIRGKYADALQHQRNAARFKQHRHTIMLRRLLTMEWALNRHLAGLSLPTWDKLAPEQREVVNNGKRGGRPYDFPLFDTLAWFDELSVLPEYQKHGGRARIIREIEDRHEKRKGERPGEDTIRDQLRKAGRIGG
jgi:hypothetical protein